MDEDTRFQKAVNALERTVEKQGTEKSAKVKKRRQDQNLKADLLKIVRMCSDRNFIPVIVFAFSKKVLNININNLVNFLNF